MAGKREFSAQEVRNAIIRAQRGGEGIVEIKRSPIGSLPLLALPLIVLIFIPIVIIPFLVMGVIGYNMGYSSWLYVNICLVVPLGLIALIAFPASFLAFFNNYKLVIGGKLIVGHRYTLDYDRMVVIVEHRGILTSTVLGANKEKGQPIRKERGAFTLYYKVTRETSFLDVRNVDMLPQGVIQKLFGYGDVVIPTAQSGSTELFDDVDDPEYVQKSLMEAARFFREGKNGD